MNSVTFRYRSHRDPQTELRRRVREIAQVRVRMGYRKSRVLLQQRRKRQRRVAEHRRERFHFQRTEPGVVDGLYGGSVGGREQAGVEASRAGRAITGAASSVVISAGSRLHLTLRCSGTTLQSSPVVPFTYPTKGESHIHSSETSNGSSGPRQGRPETLQS